MIIALGIDITSTDRIKKSVKKYGEKFISKILTTEEQKQYRQSQNKDQFLASRFSAKESFYKAVSSMANPQWHDVSVIRKINNKAELKILNPKLKTKLKNFNLHLSVSHDSLNIVTACILERNR